MRTNMKAGRLRMEKYSEWRCSIPDPDGYLIEVVQSTTVKYG
jgi:hypothetical protein